MNELVAYLLRLDCVVVEVCEPHPENPSPNIMPVERQKLLNALTRPDLLPELKKARDLLWSSGNGAPYKNIPAETLDFLEKLDVLLKDDKLKDGYYWFKCERASERSIAQFIEGKGWFAVNETGPLTLEELNRRGWELDEPVS